MRNYFQPASRSRRREHYYKNVTEKSAQIMQTLITLEMNFDILFMNFIATCLGIRRGNLLARMSIDLQKYFDYCGNIEKNPSKSEREGLEHVTRYTALISAMGTAAPLRVIQLLILGHPKTLIAGQIGDALAIPRLGAHQENCAAILRIRSRSELGMPRLVPQQESLRY